MGQKKYPDELRERATRMTLEALADPTRAKGVMRGSVTFLRTWVRGWRDRAVVVEDGISAGSQDEGMTTLHSSPPRGPRPRLNDTPPRQTGSATPHPPTLPTPWPPPERPGARSAPAAPAQPAPSWHAARTQAPPGHPHAEPVREQLYSPYPHHPKHQPQNN